MKYVIYLKGERGVGVLKGLEDKGIVPAVCVAEKDDKTIRTFCKKLRIPYIVEDMPRRKEHIDLVLSYKPDLLVCAGYSRILPGKLFRDLRFGAINCHGGRLPQYRGASPIPWQIIRGETHGAAYVLKMTGGIDDGPILAKERYEIKPEETARDVTDKVVMIFRRLIPVVIGRYAAGKLPRATKQPESGACHWTRRTPEDGRIDFNNLTSKQVVDLIRALDDPYPGAFIVHKGRKYIVRRARLYDKKMAGMPGRVVGKTQAGVLILAKDGAVEILELSCGAKKMAGLKFPAKYGDLF